MQELECLSLARLVMCNCSACGISAKETQKMISINANNGFFICDKCVLSCLDIINTQEGIEIATITLKEHQRLLGIEREAEPTRKKLQELKNIVLSMKTC
jgi:ATP-dependent protease Clp ATPase subunit